MHESILSAIQREKSLKKYKRDWKINLIERENPHWDDLYPALVGMRPTEEGIFTANETVLKQP
jgi:putative endonuclease